MKQTKLPYLNWDFFRRQDANDAEQEALNGMRQAYMQAIDAMLDKTAERFDRPELAQLPVQDLALVTVFLASVKMVEFAGQQADKRAVLGAANFLIHRITEEFPDMAQHLGEANGN